MCSVVSTVLSKVFFKISCCNVPPKCHICQVGVAKTYNYFEKGCRKNVHPTIPKGNMGYDQYTVPHTAAVEPTFLLSFSTLRRVSMAPLVILSNFFEGERNNCFSKIQLVGQKYQDKTALASKTRFSRHCFGFQSRRFSLLVAYNI